MHKTRFRSSVLALISGLLLPAIAATASAAVPKVVNVSTRGLTVQPSDPNVDRKLIGGFVTNSAGDILVRVVGPTYQSFVPVFAPDTQMKVFRQEGAQSILVGENDDWPQTQEMRSAIDETGAAPYAANTRDAAILLKNQPPGAYTVHATYLPIENGGIGNVASFEAYQLGISSSPTGLFANVSTRGRVSTGDRILIPGIVVKGDHGTTMRVLVRAVGPTLGQVYGVADTLPDPTLGIFDGSGQTVASNDDWAADPTNRQACIDAVAATGAFPLVEGSLDAALVLDLPSGAYTALCSGKPGASEGNALVEVYRLPSAP